MTKRGELTITRKRLFIFVIARSDPKRNQGEATKQSPFLEIVSLRSSFNTIQGDLDLIGKLRVTLSKPKGEWN